MNKTYKDITGQTFNRLTAVKRVKSKNKGAYWLFNCACGDTCTALGSRVTSGKRKSCGCLQKEKAKAFGERSKLGTVSSLKEIYASYKARAKRKGFIFDLTFDYFCILTAQECYYCGALPYQHHRSNTPEFVYSGIDRVDSTKGYISNNVVACCGKCNYAKGTMSMDEFIRWARSIVEKHHE